MQLHKTYHLCRGFPLGIEGVEVGLGHPAGQPRIGEIEAGPLHRIDAHPARPGPPVSSRSPETPSTPGRFRSGATNPRPLQSRGGPVTPAGWVDPGSSAGGVRWRRLRRRSGQKRGRRHGGPRWLGGRKCSWGVSAG